MKAQTVVQGFGAAMLLMISLLAPLISPYHAVLYHSMLPMRSVVWGTLIDLAVATLFAALLLHYLERRPAGLRTLVWALIAAALVHTLLGVPAALLGLALPPHTRQVAAVVTLAAALLLWKSRPPQYALAVRGLLVLLLLAGLNALWMVPELLYFGLHPQRPDAAGAVTHAAVAPARTAAAGDGRIVWLLFDELSYDQTFDHRFAGLAMPTFEKFKSQSVVFRNLQAVGSATDLVIPSFFLGMPVRKIRSNLEGEPKVQLAGSDQWQAFDDHPTLFSDAHRLGWTTGVVGWFNPYCRILASTLDYCFWRMGDGEFGGPVSTNSSLQNAISPIQSAVWWLQRQPGQFQRAHEEDFAAIVPAATALIRDERIRFVFIHLPVPHLPGIYDRKIRALRAGGTYIDNLALSDKVLDQLISSVNATSTAANTTIIVCSDHSWRVPLWKSRPLWSKEDEGASQGRIDPRPVLMIHFPEQHTEHDVTAAFDEIKIHEIVERLLHDEKPEFVF